MITGTTTVIKKDGVEEPHLIIRISTDNIHLEINGMKIFETLAHREVIVGLLNKKFNELLHKYLETAMLREKDRNEA